MSEQMSEHWQEHAHQALAHNHRHFHVTHNWKSLEGGFEHLSSEHDHEHDHAPLTHTHVPHEDFEAEHQGEAHIHDHEQAVRPATARKAAGAKKTPSKAGGDGEGQTGRTRRTAKAAG